MDWYTNEETHVEKKYNIFGRPALLLYNVTGVARINTKSDYSPDRPWKLKPCPSGRSLGSRSSSEIYFGSIRSPGAKILRTGQNHQREKGVAVGYKGSAVTKAEARERPRQGPTKMHCLSSGGYGESLAAAPDWRYCSAIFLTRNSFRTGDVEPLGFGVRWNSGSWAEGEKRFPASLPLRRWTERDGGSASGPSYVLCTLSSNTIALGAHIPNTASPAPRPLECCESLMMMNMFKPVIYTSSQFYTRIRTSVRTTIVF